MNFFEKHHQASGFHVTGYSLGGILAGLLAGTDTRVESLMIFVSAGSIADIVVDSHASILSDLRIIHEHIFKKLGWTRESARKIIQKLVANVEPLTYAKRVDPRKVLIVSAGLDSAGILDTTIPGSAVWATWDAYGQPEWIELPLTGHLSSALAGMPVWIELPTMHFVLLESYIDHILKEHFIPKTLQ